MVLRLVQSGCLQVRGRLSLFEATVSPTILRAVWNVGRDGSNDGSNSGSHLMNDQDHHASAWSIQVLCDFCRAAVGAKFDLQNVTVLYL